MQTHILNLYPATLLYSLMNSSSFLVITLGFAMYSIMSSANSDDFSSPFPTWICFISFASLIAVTSSSKHMLNKSGKSGHPCLFHDLRGNAFSFAQLSAMLAVDLPYMAFIVWRCCPSRSTF
uniref:Uncharacterized protein n=1 Tax=Sus scrofa TaxID=9823 RepID=A0A8D0V8P0_PIG